jgi:hypothetical protein
VATETTIVDITNKRLINNWEAPPHRLEDMANTIPELDEAAQPASALSGPPSCQPTRERPHNWQTRQRPLQKVDLFVEDFIVDMGQGSVDKLSNIRCTLLHSLDNILHPLDDGGSLALSA